MSATFVSSPRTAAGAARQNSRPAPHFTLNGDAALEQHIAHVCKNVLAGIGQIVPEHKLEGLVLGGGYGRGEGGVLRTPEGDQPYNDLEFYVLVRGHSWLNERRYARALHELSKTLSLLARVELEFKIISSVKLRRSPKSLFYHDLVMGHRWLLGDESLLAGCKHHCEAESLSLSEATRLLMNRCSGLLFAREMLEQQKFSAGDADFIRRNVAKTELALGDAVLIAFGKYHWSCRERNRRLCSLDLTEELSWLEEVRMRHASGVEFKLLPHQSTLSRGALQEDFGEVRSLAIRVWLWLEGRRLGCSFQSATDYSSSQINKWPDTSSWRNRLANIRVFGFRALLLRPKRRHPRERILNALVLLLWGGAETSPEPRTQVEVELMTPMPTGLIAAYRERWNRAS